MVVATRIKMCQPMRTENTWWLAWFCGRFFFLIVSQSEIHYSSGFQIGNISRLGNSLWSMCYFSGIPFANPWLLIESFHLHPFAALPHQTSPSNIEPLPWSMNVTMSLSTDKLTPFYHLAIEKNYWYTRIRWLTLHYIATSKVLIIKRRACQHHVASWSEAVNNVERHANCP